MTTYDVVVTNEMAQSHSNVAGLGVDLVSLKQNVDTTLPTGRLTFQVLRAVAEFEREMLRERVKAEMAPAIPK